MSSHRDRLTIHITDFISVNILFFPILAASILGRYFSLFSIAFTIAILHELSHIFAAVRLGVGISDIELLPFGVCAHLKSNIIKNPWHEIAIAISGPLMNLFLAALFVVLSRLLPLHKELWDYAIYCSIAMAIVNLLPCLPLDGGRIVRAALTLVFGAMPAYNFILKLSRIVIILLLVIASYALMTSGFNFSLILIGTFLLGNLYGEHKNITRQALTELLYYKNKLNREDLTRSTVITAHSSTPARRLLRRLSYNRYHIIHIVDDNMNICKTLTESSIIKALVEKGIRITLGEL